MSDREGGEDAPQAGQPSMWLFNNNDKAKIIINSYKMKLVKIAN